MAQDVWAIGDAYEAYVGRWSRRVAAAFLSWLEIPAGGRWLDVGCGTGALSAAVLAEGEPTHVLGIDPSEGFLTAARRRVDDPRVDFAAADARALPVADHRVDTVVSGLALNFVPDPRPAVAEFARVMAPGGVAAAYVWDYSGGMAMMRYFWAAAIELDPSAAELDEGRRFPLCRPDALGALWADNGFGEVAVRAIEVPTVFTNFDDYWQPFLGGQGPAPGYAMSLSEERRDLLRELLRSRLPVGPRGSIPLHASAWAVRGRSPA